MPCAGRIYQQLSTLSGPLWMLARSAITLSTSQIITVQFQYLPGTEYNLTLQNQYQYALCQKFKSIHSNCIYFSFFQSGQGKQKLFQVIWKFTRSVQFIQPQRQLVPKWLEQNIIHRFISSSGFWFGLLGWTHGHFQPFTVTF